MDKKLGFIGIGNMGSAILGGVVKAKLFSAQNITVYDINENTIQNISKEYDIVTASSNKHVAESSDIIFLCIKPHIYETVILEIKDIVKKDAIIVAIAAGQSLEALHSQFNEGTKIIRAMPNTPLLVSCGMTALCPGDNLSRIETENILAIFSSLGRAQILEEHLFDAFTGIAGSSPAYAFIFIDALADAGVKYGLSRKQSLEFSAQTLMGAAKMLLETGEHPAALKDAVCSPGGATIEAVAALEYSGFRASILDAVSACIEKSIKMTI